MDKQQWKSVLSSSTNAALPSANGCKDALAGALQKVTDPGVRADIRRMRLIDEEVLIRQNLSSRRQVRRSKSA